MARLVGISNPMEFMMQKKTKFALAAGTLGILVIGGVAGVANADGGWGKGPGGWGKGHGRGMMAGQLMERYDTNKDGKISQEEIDANRTEWHAEFDADKNATLSLDEFQNLWLKAHRERMVRDFQRLDRDGNGQVTLDEYKQPLSSIVADHDRNGDGFLSRDDRRERHGKRGDRMRGHGKGMMERQQGGDGPGDPPPPPPESEGGDQQ